MSDGPCPEVLGWPMSAYSRAAAFGHGRLNLVGRLGRAAYEGGLGSEQIRLLVDLVHGPDMLELMDGEG